MIRKLFLVFSWVTLVACSTSPLGRKQLLLAPEQQVETLGASAFSAMKQKKPVSTHPTDNRFVKCVAEALIKQTGGHWEIVVFDDPSANAFALPGGKIGVHTGILSVTKNQDQLATVLGHELAHVIAHHANERLSQQTAVQQGMNLINAVAQPGSASGQLLMGALGLGAQYGILLPYSRTQESEADIYGLELMAKAGFDPRESIHFWQNMDQQTSRQQPEFLSTHPSHDSRIRELEKHIPKVMARYPATKRGQKDPGCSWKR